MTVSLRAAMDVWRVIASLVRETRGGVVNLSPRRVKKFAKASGVIMDAHFRRAMRLILRYAFRDCRLACARRNGRDGYKPICYVFNRRCVEEVLRRVGL